MGHSGLPIICENLKKHGMSENTPVAVISKGTTAE
jgi:siroheme synthase